MGQLQHLDVRVTDGDCRLDIGLRSPSRDRAAPTEPQKSPLHVIGFLHEQEFTFSELMRFLISVETAWDPRILCCTILSPGTQAWALVFIVSASQNLVDRCHICGAVPAFDEVMVVPSDPLAVAADLRRALAGAVLKGVPCCSTVATGLLFSPTIFGRMSNDLTPVAACDRDIYCV